MEINDVIVQDIEWKAGRITLVRETDPLLRRFGQCDLVSLEFDQTIEIWRQQADEVWSVLQETATFWLKDERQDSPSHQAQQKVTLSSQRPQVILVPFGVSCKVATEHSAGAMLVRLTTHQDSTHPGDKTP